MSRVKSVSTKLPELSWLSEVAESRQPLSESCPIWVRHGTISSGPTLPHPERHPYCEFGIGLTGEAIAFVEREKSVRLPGDLFLAGPGVPHWAKVVSYPVKFIVVYFLPGVLIELGPQIDGPKFLRRFTARQSIHNRVVRPSQDLRRKLTRLFGEMVVEFESSRIGRELKLRAILAEQLVALLRWEEKLGRKIEDVQLEVDWMSIYKALQFLREHHSGPVYAQNVARAAGMSESKMKTFFYNAVGVSWVKYLQGFRIHRAATLLIESAYNVTEAAFAVGFESLSHFNHIFRFYMGVSPTEYAKLSFEKSISAGRQAPPKNSEK